MMVLDLSVFSLGQLQALAAVVGAAIVAGERAKRDGVPFEAALDVDEEFATVTFGWPCDVAARVAVAEGGA